MEIKNTFLTNTNYIKKRETDNSSILNETLNFRKTKSKGEILLNTTQNKFAFVNKETNESKPVT